MIPMSRVQTLLTTFTRLAATGVAVIAITLIAMSPNAAQAQPKAKAKIAGPDIMLMQPKVLKAGDNQFEVMVKGADGNPIADADVLVLFVMPAMPAMRMAEMRNEFTLKPSGEGVYIG